MNAGEKPLDQMSTPERLQAIGDAPSLARLERARESAQFGYKPEADPAAGQLVTIVFRVFDVKEFRTFNMIGERFKGMESVAISAGDRIEECHTLRATVERLNDTLFP